MTHWYRLPSQVSVAKLLFNRKQQFIVNRGLPPELKRSLPVDARFLDDIPEADSPSREEVIELCREKHGILVTCDEDYTSPLRIDARGAWGVILLPSDVESQIRHWRRMASGDLTFLPTNETMDLVEYARRNRMLLDIRNDPPILTFHSQCRWISRDSKSR